MKLGVFNSFTLFFSIGLIVIVGLSYTFFMNIEIVEKSITHSLSLEKISKKLHFSKLSNGTLVWSNQHQMRDSHTTDNKDDSIGHFLIYFNEKSDFDFQKFYENIDSSGSLLPDITTTYQVKGMLPTTDKETQSMFANYISDTRYEFTASNPNSAFKLFFTYYLTKKDSYLEIMDLTFKIEN